MRSLIEKIRALLARANHPNTPLAEAETALALASKLMQKHGLGEGDLALGQEDDITVTMERVRITGPYRVQRTNVLYEIAKVHSCAGYRDFDENNASIFVVFGRASDVRAVRTLFTAADLLGARTLPRGSRSARTAWWQGFREGLGQALAVSRAEFLHDTPGAGLVLADRKARAESEMKVAAPPLRKTYSYSDAASGDYQSGRTTGRGFGAAGRSFTSGIRGELS
jgi:hypothetical protein